MSNSPLVQYTRISPNRTPDRYMYGKYHKISKITIHHMAGVLSVEDFGNIVAKPAREMSANYAIGYDGRIGLFCPEADRSWCSSSAKNDLVAVTIEVSNSAYGDASGWPISDASYKALIRLCVDICKRNGIPKLYYDGTNGTLTRHCDLVATLCPGPYIKSKTQQICNDVNARLGSSSSTPLGLYTISLTTGTPIYDIETMKKTGEINASTKYTITEEKTINGSKYGRLKSGAGWVVVEAAKPQEPKTPQSQSYTKSFKANELVYKEAGGSTIGTVGANGVFTIVEEKKVGYKVFGKLKSGAGWVVVKDETPKPTSWWSGKYDAQIKELQQILNVGGAKLTVDGIAGDKTFEACKKYTVVSGDKGNLIKWVQKRLGVTADGIAGTQTMNAIYNFQRKNGLGVGYLGGNDWKYLIR